MIKREGILKLIKDYETGGFNERVTFDHDGVTFEHIYSETRTLLENAHPVPNPYMEIERLINDNTEKIRVDFCKGVIKYIA